MSTAADFARVRARLERLLAEDAELREAVPSLAAMTAITACPTTIGCVAKAFELYADRACFGERSAGGPYRMLRYSDVWARIEAFASGLKHEGLVSTGDFVGICGFGSVDWVVADLACIYLAAVSAPFQTGMSPGEVKALVRHAKLRCIVCSEEQRAAIEAILPDCPSVKSLIVMGAGTRDTPHVYSMEAIELRGRERGIVPAVPPSARGERDPLMTLFYTSGSTGTPKGAMFPESLIHAHWRPDFFVSLDLDLLELPSLTLNYLPLNHAAGREMITRSIVRGGTTYFVAKSDMSTLFEDAKLARPTTILLVPRVAGAIYQRFQAELARRSVDANEHDRVLIERELVVEMGTSLLGDRLLILLTGSAPTPPEVASFLERCFQVPVIDGYGSTELGPVTMENRIKTDMGIRWKLVDVPELGYRASDQPYPRGELHVKSPFAIPGYFKDEGATKKLFDEEGFVKTGDIVEQRGPDTLVWIDRATNVLKLAQGEFVATSRLEGIYASRSPFIRQIYVHGDSFHAYLLAVIVPDLEAASRVAKDEASLKSLLRAELDRIAREEQLRSHEVPRDILVERAPFTVENGLLTASAKQSRPRLEARYRTQIENMHAAIDRAQVEELFALRGPLSRAPIAERVRKAMGVTLGLADLGGAETEQSFIRLGGDSLSAVGLAALLHDITGVNVPVGFLLDPTSSVRAVVAYVERAVAGQGARDVTFADVHGAGATSIRADDVGIERFLGEDEINAAKAARRDLPARAEVALLTGANGFMGRFLVLELLERLTGAKKKLYALVRAPNDAAARERLAASYRTDPRLRERFEALSSNLEVLAGDLIEPRFGLRDEVYARLAEEVDLIVHNGALVNHALGYEQLFEPNVLGTVRLMRLALDRRIKAIAYVSTVGVLSTIQRPVTIREDEDLRTLVPELPTSSGYAAGYAASKWVSELLLGDANEKLGLPLSVFRPTEIMAHSEYRGQVNVPDFFTRLLAGIVYTGLAPSSFYAPNAPAHVRHFDGSPVEIVARSIAALSVARDPSVRACAYNVVNPHRADGVSLDAIVDWVKSAGYAVERVLDYDEWYRRFHDRLVSLSEPARQHSPLPILDAWSQREGTHRAPVIDAALLLARLRGVDPGLAELPHVGEAIIHKTLGDLTLLAVIDPPLQLSGPRAGPRAGLRKPRRPRGAARG